MCCRMLLCLIGVTYLCIMYIHGKIPCEGKQCRSMLDNAITTRTEKMRDLQLRCVWLVALTC